MKTQRVKKVFTYKLATHHAYYIGELLLFVFGGLLMFFFSYDLVLQFFILTFLLLSYITVGLIHHHLHHDLRGAIVVEYILISSLILGGFLFFNAGRL